MLKDIEQVARLYAEAYDAHQRAVERRSKRVDELKRHMEVMHVALLKVARGKEDQP